MRKRKDSLELHSQVLSILNGHMFWKEVTTPSEEKSAKEAFLSAVKLILAHKPDRVYVASGNCFTIPGHLSYFEKLISIYWCIDRGRYMDACNELEVIAAAQPMGQHRIRGGLELLMKKAENQEEVWETSCGLD